MVGRERGSADRAVLVGVAVDMVLTKRCGRMDSQSNEGTLLDDA